MEKDTLVNMLMTKNMVMGNSRGKMAVSTKDIGASENNMAEELSLYLMEKRKKAFGKMEDVYNGLMILSDFFNKL